MYTHLNAWTLSHTGFTQHRTQHLKIHMTALRALQSLTHTLAVVNYSLHTPSSMKSDQLPAMTNRIQPRLLTTHSSSVTPMSRFFSFLFFLFSLTLAPHSIPLYGSLSASRTCLSLFQSGWRSLLCRWHGFEQFGRRSHHLVL